MFKKKKVAWKVDTNEVLKKIERQKYELDLIKEWQAAAEQLEVPEDYYYIQDGGPHGYKIVRVYHWVRKHNDLRRIVAEGGELSVSDIRELKECNPKVQVEHRTIGSPKGYSIKEDAVGALDRIVDPDKYRTKYHVTPPLREMK